MAKSPLPKTHKLVPMLVTLTVPADTNDHEVQNDLDGLLGDKIFDDEPVVKLFPVVEMVTNLNELNERCARDPKALTIINKLLKLLDKATS